MFLSNQTNIWYYIIYILKGLSAENCHHQEKIPLISKFLQHECAFFITNIRHQLLYLYM
jgi:hypothetical protein